ncbi:hypothetical protein FRB97_007056 [Tulasnella sp. 331]|nr:hypothetical protein FRB97_007056 [Tulasnella sp. 331]
MQSHSFERNNSSRNSNQYYSTNPTVPVHAAAAAGAPIAAFEALIANTNRRTQTQNPWKLRKGANSGSHGPEWIKPWTCTEPTSKYTKPDLSIQGILKGQTKSPVALGDLRAFLNGREGSGEGRMQDTAALDFLLVLDLYKSAFFSLAPAERAPRPATVLEHFSLLQFGNPRHGEEGEARTAPPVPSKDTPPASPMVFDLRHTRHALTPPPAAAIRYRRIKEASTHDLSSSIFYHNREEPSRYSPVYAPSESTSTLTSIAPVPSNLLDPALQPFRAELQSIIDNHLSGDASHLLMTIVPPNIVMDALSETELTTHPETLEPLANLLTQHLDERVLPDFLNQAVINLSTTTKIYRVIVACLSWGIVVMLTVISMVFPHRFPRGARLLVLPFVLIGIGYLIGSQKGVCFVLVWRGVREPKWYQAEARDPEMGQPDLHPPLSIAEVDARRISTAHTIVPPSLLSLSRIRSLNSLQSNRMGLHQEPRSSGTTIRSSNPLDFLDLTAEKGGRISPESISSRRSVLEPKRKGTVRVRWQTLVMRMAGTAVDTVPVEDQTVREKQTRIAIRVAAWLALGTMAVMALVLALPPIRARS